MRAVDSFMAMDEYFSFPTLSTSGHISHFADFLFLGKKKRSQKMMRKLRTTTVASLIFYNPVVETVAEKSVKLKILAEMTLRNPEIDYWEKMLRFLDNTDSSLKGLVFQLVSTHIDPSNNKLLSIFFLLHSNLLVFSIYFVGFVLSCEGTMKANLSNEATLELSKINKTEGKQVSYKLEFQVDSNFGVPGAITVINKYQKELFLESVTIEGVVQFACDSWVQPDKIHPEKRIFFSNKVKILNFLQQTSLS